MSEATITPRRVPADSPLANVIPLWAVTATQSRRPPRLRTGALHRERLVRRLVQAADVPMILLAAPAGYGKSTVLAQWLAADPRPCRWISFEDTHDEPRRVLAVIAQALDDLRGEGGRPSPVTAPTLGAVRRSLEGMEGPFVLVLDDLHGVRSREALAALPAIAEFLPEGSQLALASRDEPAIPIGRLRAQGRLMDLRARDLAMSRGEAAAMLRLAGLELPADDVLTLLGRTEGWPAALYLAALSISGRPDAHRAVAHFGGDDRLASDYLHDEVLSGLDPESVDFLRATSVVGLLTAPLCDALRRRTGSGRLLRRLSRSNALVTGVDSVDETYRCHPMLAGMLRAELHRLEPELEIELHSRASAWYAAAGDLDGAVEHAIDAGDVDRAGDLLWASAAEHVLDGRGAIVRRRLDRFGREQIAAHPALALTAAACHLAAGDRDVVDHWAETAARAIGDGEEARSLRAGVAVMRAAVARNGIAEMDADAARGYALASEDSPWRSLCCLLRGVAAHLQGHPDEARRQLEEGARRGGIAAPSIQVLCLAQLSLLALRQADWERGRLLVSRAMAQVERRELSAHPMSAPVFAVSAMVGAHRDRVEQAQSDRRRATELLTTLDDAVPWLDIATRVALATAALRLGDVVGARTLLSGVSRTHSATGELPVLCSWMDELWSQLDAFSATTLVGPSSLTTAELRVLALLPTHLSFREMGRRLHVSANTIKTHAHAVYRKLDVRSRSEAVVRARDMGLLDLRQESPCPAS